MKFQVISLFPDAFESYLKASIIGRAIQEKKISVDFFNPMDFAKKVGGRIDKRPYGGGPGMVVQAEPVLLAYEEAQKNNRGKRNKTIFFTTEGKELNQKVVYDYLEYEVVTLICGHYEGIDDRVAQITGAEKVHVGKTILSGGELPALFVIDTLTRQIEGVVGNTESIEQNRKASSKVYTRPETLEWKMKEYKVPDVLVSGNHEDISKWRESDSKKKKL